MRSVRGIPPIAKANQTSHSIPKNNSVASHHANNLRQHATFNSATPFFYPSCVFFSLTTQMRDASQPRPLALSRRPLGRAQRIRRPHRENGAQAVKQSPDRESCRNGIGPMSSAGPRNRGSHNSRRSAHSRQGKGIKVHVPPAGTSGGLECLRSHPPPPNSPPRPSPWVLTKLTYHSPPTIYPHCSKLQTQQPTDGPSSPKPSATL